MRKFLVLLLVFLLWIGVAGPSQASLLTNGDFEGIDGTGSLDGWTTEGDVRLAGTDSLLGQFAEAQGMEGHYALLGLCETSGTSALSQSFSVSGVTQLEIAFNWAFDYFDNSSPAEDTFLSFVNMNDGNSIYNITLLDLQTGGTFCYWDADTIYGTYTDVIDISPWVSDTGTIMFSLIEQDDWWCFTGTASVAGIDNVSVTPVPEPGAMALFGFGVFGLGWVSRKRLRL